MQQRYENGQIVCSVSGSGNQATCGGLSRSRLTTWRAASSPFTSDATESL